MRLIEDFNAVPTLRFLMVTRIVIWAWNHPNIVRSISQMLDNLNEIEVEQMWEEILDHVRAIVQSIVGIPEGVRPDLDAVIIPIGFHIREMRTFMNYCPFLPSSHIEFPVDFWTPYGTVDITRQDAIQVRNERRQMGFRYNLACHDCFEDMVEELFPLLTPPLIYDFRQMNPQNELLSYWTHRMMESLEYFVLLNFFVDVGGGPNVANKLAFQYTLKDGSKSGIEYFSRKLPFEDFEYVTRYFLFYLDERPDTLWTRAGFLPIPPKEHYSDSTYFLLSRFDEEQRNTILPGLHTAVMLNFLMYPFYGLFNTYGNIWRSNFSCQDFEQLLTRIVILRILNTNFFEYHLFADLYRSCPEAYKLEIRNSATERHNAGNLVAGLMLELMTNFDAR
ncbi:hypothetical protein TNIN_299561 [Trichonephila inaurata madagascariensis]|uniref:Uncharacterized protein n=1 Tax=Trichonephila inaurata madagascariensis TaxID=2747483 RepID=A0A8X7BVP9_9ARAC|nr:hypothetical protein TNIN_299561 [Trichonephila inaurata madagascariensis]